MLHDAEVPATDRLLLVQFITRRSLKTLHIIDMGVDPDEGVQSPIDPLYCATRAVLENPPPSLQFVAYGGVLRPVCLCRRRRRPTEPRTTTASTTMWDRPSLSEWKAETGILPVDEYHDLDDWVWLRKHDEQDELSGSLSLSIHHPWRCIQEFR